jgi:hypothetical protein
VSLPPTPLVSFGVSYAGSNPHAPDENIRLEDFVQGIKYFGRLIHRLAQIGREERREPSTLESFVQFKIEKS